MLHTLDFNKAFDKIDCIIFLDKLEQYVMDGSTTRWIHSCLNNCVVFSGSVFTWNEIWYMVLQALEEVW